MHRGRSQKLNKVQHFLSLRGRRRHDGDVGDITINAFPYRCKRPADPLLGYVPVAYDDMETRLKFQTFMILKPFIPGGRDHMAHGSAARIGEANASIA